MVNARGFTLLEALVSVVLLAAGIAVSVETMASITRSGTQNRETEIAQRLAYQKLDEIAVQPASASGGSSTGDFTAEGESLFEWRSRRTPTDVANLDAVRIEVGRKGTGFARALTVQGLASRPRASQESP